MAARSHQWIWVDLADAGADLVNAVAHEFGLDRTVVDDVFGMELLPKLDDQGDHLYVVLHDLVPHEDRIDTREVDAIVTDRALITVHDGELDGVERLWVQVQRSRDSEGELDPSHLLGHLAEIVGRRFLEVVIELDRRLDDLSDRALTADAAVLAEVQMLRRETSILRTMVQPQRQVLRSMLTIGTPLVTRAGRGRLRDAADVHDQVVESVETARALLGDVLDTYRGASGEKLAEITRVLTVYAAILLPLSLITGWFGMNHENLPLLSESWGWVAVTVAMVLFASVQWSYFVRRGFVRRIRRRSASPERRGLGSRPGPPAR